MKTMKNMSDLIQMALVAVVLASATRAMAFTYADGDLLLIFRKNGYKDVEFNVGTVSNLLGKASGTIVPISYDVNAVKTNYNNSFSGVNCILVAATSMSSTYRRVWCTDGDTNQIITPMNKTLSDWSGIQAVVKSTGDEAAKSGTSGNVYVVTSTDPTSFSYIAGGGVDEFGTLLGDPNTLNGGVPFPAQMFNPGQALLCSLKPMNPPVTTAPATNGYFSWSTNGTLTFTAGPLTQSTNSTPLVPTSITRIERGAAVSTIYFTTTNTQNYRLHWRSDLSTGSWTTNATTVAGDGTIRTLTDTTSVGVRFYRVETLR
jgi:hypothetical protein